MSDTNTTTTTLTALLGHKGPNGDPVYARLTEKRPHVRWVGSIGIGKSTSLRAAATELIAQIPDTGNPRMFLFESDAFVPTFIGMEHVPGVAVVPLSDHGPAVDHLWSELARRNGQSSNPIVIAIDDYFRAIPALRDLAMTIEADTLPGVHLALASHVLRDFTHGVQQTEKRQRFKALVREQICGAADHGWDTLTELACEAGIGWRPPELRDQRVLRDGTGVEESEIRFGVQGYLRGLDKVMYYDLLPHPDKYTTVVLGSREVDRDLPFVSQYPELERGRVPFAATSGTPQAFTPTRIESPHKALKYETKQGD